MSETFSPWLTLTIRHFQKIYILSLAELSDEHMKHLYLGLSLTFFSVRHDRSLWTLPTFGDVQRETKARNPLRVRTADLFTRKFTSFTLCYYVIGQFNRAQTNHKHKRKRVWFGCEQPFLWGKHCVTTQKTAAEETKLPLALLKANRKQANHRAI